MSAFQIIILYALAIIVFYLLIIWFIHKASLYFKKQGKAINKALSETETKEPFSNNQPKENTSLTTGNNIECLEKQEGISTSSEQNENK